MPAKRSRVCIDRVIPLELRQKARDAAARVNPANRTSPFEATALATNLWAPGSTLKICFLGGHPIVQNRVKEHAYEWTKHANIHFDFGDHEEAQIRIAFRNDGSWSAVGTDALVAEYFPKGEPTMNFGWLETDSTDAVYSEVVLHEFGHVLGLIHEHQNPSGGIQWDKDVVYAELAGSPNYWDKQTVDHNLFETYDRTLTQFTEFDPDSIMLYAFPAEWTLNDVATHTNSLLSATDKEFITARYPR